MKDRRRKHAATRMREMWRKETIRMLGQHDRCTPHWDMFLRGMKSIYTTKYNFEYPA